MTDLQSGGCGFEYRPGLLRTKVYSAFHHSGVGKWVPAAAGKAKTGMAHSDCWWTCGCAGKTVRSLENTHHTWALLRWCFTIYEEALYQVYAPFTFTSHVPRKKPDHVTLGLWLGYRVTVTVRLAHRYIPHGRIYVTWRLCSNNDISGLGRGMHSTGCRDSKIQAVRIWPWPFTFDLSVQKSVAMQLHAQGTIFPPNVTFLRAFVLDLLHSWVRTEWRDRRTKKYRPPVPGRKCRRARDFSSTNNTLCNPSVSAVNKHTSTQNGFAGDNGASTCRVDEQ